MACPRPGEGWSPCGGTRMWWQSPIYRIRQQSPSWSPVGGAYCPFISLTSRNRATLPSLAGDHEGRPYGLSGLVPVFMASVDAYCAFRLFTPGQALWSYETVSTP
jgi:hypothetical protein